jgi:hypothetical protein
MKDIRVKRKRNAKNYSTISLNGKNYQYEEEIINKFKEITPKLRSSTEPSQVSGEVEGFKLRQRLVPHLSYLCVIPSIPQFLNH